MNSQAVYVGQDYALDPYPQKGKFQMYGKRVRILRKYSRIEYGNEKSTSYAKVQYVNDDGTVKEGETSVRIRDLIDFWENYVAERDAIQRERDAEVARKAAERENNERIINDVHTMFSRMWYKHPPFEVGSSQHSKKVIITFDRKELLNWLGISEDLPASIVDNLPGDRLY